MLTNLFVPETLSFSDLGLEREPVTQRLLFAPGGSAETRSCSFAPGTGCGSAA